MSADARTQAHADARRRTQTHADTRRDTQRHAETRAALKTAGCSVVFGLHAYLTAMRKLGGLMLIRVLLAAARFLAWRIGGRAGRYPL